MRHLIAEFFEITAGASFNVPPKEALDYFNAKGLRSTFAWGDMLREEHATAFTVAKMLDMDMLKDVQDSLDLALTTGQTFSDWAKNIVPMLQAKGWWGRKEMRDPLTGKTIIAQLGSPWRLETIFRTNLQTAYSAGQWQQIMDQADIAPYLMYDAVDDFRTRAQHKAWDNKVLPVTDKFWRSHYPPNGFNCRCGVIQLSDDDLDEMGLSIDPSPRIKYGPWTNPRTGRTEQVPDGIDPGFNYNPGKARYEHLQKLAQEKVKALPPNFEDAAKKGLKATQKQAEATDVPRIDASTPEGKWHAQAWESAPEWLRSTVIREQVVELMHDKGGAWARNGRIINMPNTYKPGDAHAQDVWRHEFGHILDSRLGGGWYVSAREQFTEAMTADAKVLTKAAGTGGSAAARLVMEKRMARYDAVRDLLVDLPGDTPRLEYLQREAAALDLDLDELLACIRRNSDVNLEGIAGRVRLGRILAAIKSGDVERFVYEIVDKAEGFSVTYKNWRKGQMGSLSDLIGASTKNKLANIQEGYFGHKNSYYNERKGYGQQTEAFANLTALSASPTPILWKITKRFFPQLTAAYEAIIKNG